MRHIGGNAGTAMFARTIKSGIVKEMFLREKGCLLL